MGGHVPCGRPRHQARVIGLRPGVRPPHLGTSGFQGNHGMLQPLEWEPYQVVMGHASRGWPLVGNGKVTQEKVVAVLSTPRGHATATEVIEDKATV